MKNRSWLGIPIWVVVVAGLGLLLFGVVYTSIKAQNRALELRRNNLEVAVELAQTGLTQQAQTIVDTEQSISTLQARGHDLCISFLMAPVLDGAVIDVTRLTECKEFVSDAEYQQALDHQVLRASGKLTVFLSENPFYVVTNGQQISATGEPGSLYGLTFDPLEGVISFQIGKCGETLPTNPEGTFLIYPCEAR